MRGEGGLRKGSCSFSTEIYRPPPCLLRPCSIPTSTSSTGPRSSIPTTAGDSPSWLAASQRAASDQPCFAYAIGSVTR